MFVSKKVRTLEFLVEQSDQEINELKKVVSSLEVEVETITGVISKLCTDRAQELTSEKSRKPRKVLNENSYPVSKGGSFKSITNITDGWNINSQTANSILKSYGLLYHDKNKNLRLTVYAMRKGYGKSSGASIYYSPDGIREVELILGSEGYKKFENSEVRA